MSQDLKEWPDHEPDMGEKIIIMKTTNVEKPCKTIETEVFQEYLFLEHTRRHIQGLMFYMC